MMETAKTNLPLATDLPRESVSLSIIIVNWNVCALLRNCLNSIVDGTETLSYELFVVDNGSQDGSVEMVESEFPWVRLLVNVDNPGFAAANNRALAKAGGRYVMLLNPDTLVAPGALSRLVEFMDAHPDAGAAGPYTVDGEGQIQRDSARSEYTLLSALWEMTFLYAIFPHSRLFGRHLMTWWDHNDTRAVDAVSGAAMIVRRETVAEVGLLDEQFFMYGEDIDWCKRIRDGGWEIYFVHQARIVHFKNQSMKQTSRRSSTEYYRASHRYFEKHYGNLQAAFYTLLSVLGSTFRLMAWVSIFLLKPQQRSISRSQIVSSLSLLVFLKSGNNQIE